MKTEYACGNWVAFAYTSPIPANFQTPQSVSGFGIVRRIASSRRDGTLHYVVVNGDGLEVGLAPEEILCKIDPPDLDLACRPHMPKTNRLKRSVNVSGIPVSDALKLIELLADHPELQKVRKQIRDATHQLFYSNGVIPKVGDHVYCFEEGFVGDWNVVSITSEGLGIQHRKTRGRTKLSAHRLHILRRK